MDAAPSQIGPAGLHGSTHVVGDADFNLLQLFLGILGFHTHIRKDEGQQFGHVRRSYHTAVHGALHRLIDHNQRSDLGIVCRCIGHAGTHAEGSLAVLVVLILFLRGTGLGRYLVSLDVRVFRTAVAGHTVLQNPVDGIAGFRADHLTHRIQFIGLDYVALIVRDLPKEMGRSQIAAVGHGRHRRDLLNGCDLKGLAEGIYRQGNAAEVVLRADDGIALTGQINARCRIVTEGQKIIVEGILPQPLCQLHHGGVAGLLKHLIEGQSTVTALFMAFNRLSPAVDLKSAGAGEILLQADHVLFQPHGRGDDLEGGAGLIQLRGGFVLPHGVEQIVVHLGVLIRFRIQCVQFLLRILIQLIGVI